MNTPLHIACRQRASANLITLLVKSGINPFQENKYGKTSHYYLKRALLIKEVNPRHFYDDGDRATLNGEIQARSTISPTVNRYSAAKEQISNHGTLNFLLKHRTLKSLAASAVSEYVQELSVGKSEYDISSGFKNLTMNEPTEENDDIFRLSSTSKSITTAQNKKSSKTGNSQPKDPMQFVQNLDYTLAPHLKDFLFTHCYQIKTLYNEWQYMQSSQALMNAAHDFETTNQGIVTEFSKIRRESMGNTMENSLVVQSQLSNGIHGGQGDSSIQTQAVEDDSILEGLIN